MEFGTAVQALTDDVGIYISGRLRYILLQKGGNDFPPKEFSESLVTDCEQVISVIVEAWRSSPIQVEWDIEEYIKDVGRYPPAFPPEDEVVESKPVIVRDVQGSHLAWYLPRAMSEALQAGWNHKPFNRVLFALESLQPYFASSPPVSRKSWRNNKAYFRGSEASVFPPGIYDRTSLGASAALKKNSAGSKRFLRDILEFQALIGGIIFVLHPAQYAIMRGALVRAASPSLQIAPGETIEDWELYQEIIGTWASCFTGLSIISQREAPFHRDGRSPPTMFDVLATFGKVVDPDIRAELPGIGIRFHYNPGTILAVLSKAIRHGVSISKEP
ncbi:uncharacterized protein LACBIDRAFT_336255 [Laccaria bicolor S238N-H82]|uniref:Predicted protein n=1 Tax=Laccaria bicolor (strain S238N-H82 / ATCC MYA-4686) TaxID=486041 RepID=B0E4W2_LACBS|nr:uncharacterized protein LACBIDRAFT_336255 [Laccaria bicolor S238N-H82]EDQ98119.1 predicted protein [Laccaria bicolor S238N-H82]|eukprot:XP_001891230.1 predicted protein [Laccaria bicolor S238N-H82]